MRALGIAPDHNSYVHWISAHARNKDAVRVEQLIAEAEAEGITKSVEMLTGLILAFTKRAEPLNAEKVLREIEEAGMTPTVVSYTAVIDAYKKVRNYQKCWELYERVHSAGEAVDEFLLSFMIRICAATHDAEKAVMLFEELETKGFIEYAAPYNSMIFALASRKRYAELALDYWKLMNEKGIVPDRHTFVGVLKATAQLGDVHTASDALVQMKNYRVPMSEHVYNGLIRTYAGACAQPHVQEKHVDEYLADVWVLFERMRNEGFEPSVVVLNSILQAHANALRPQELHGDVLPLYDKHRVEPDVHTYQHLAKFYLDVRELDKLCAVYDKALQKGITPNKELVNVYMEAGLRRGDTDRVISALDTYDEIQQRPPFRFLKKLGETRDMPDRLYVRLKQHRLFGWAAKKERRFTPPSFRPKQLPEVRENKGKARWRFRKSTGQNWNVRGVP